MTRTGSHLRTWATILFLAVPAATALAQDSGVKVGNPSILRNLVSAEKVEGVGTQQYDQIIRQAREKRALLPDDHPEVVRLRRIFRDLEPYSAKFNPRTKDWKWDVNIINSKQINAFCMPGGKIAFFTGILSQLKLTDDEVAMIMGHEIAHALREHARERMAKQTLTNVGALAVGVLVGGNVGELARVGGGLLGLKFSRDDEREADLIGMELAARAGYDPRAGVTLWQKMSQAAKGQPMEWFSTHPSSTSRIDAIKANLKDVMPLYEAARAKKG
jgi:predicted Zn-dependent protease